MRARIRVCWCYMTGRVINCTQWSGVRGPDDSMVCFTNFPPTDPKISPIRWIAQGLRKVVLETLTEYRVHLTQYYNEISNRIVRKWFRQKSTPTVEIWISPYLALGFALMWLHNHTDHYLRISEFRLFLYFTHLILCQRPLPSVFVGPIWRFRSSVYPFATKIGLDYYQWIPFMLGLQGLMFYIPRIVWQLICSHRTGTDLEHLVTVATQAGQAGPEDRQKLVTHVASSLETMLYQHAEYRTGRITNFKKRMYKACGLLVVSKRLGTWLAFSYFFIKLCYLTNSIGQLYLMQRFLGFNETMGNFGAQLANYMLEGRNWEQTRIFPRISFCYLADIRQLGSVNRYVAQCVLPVNMLNEKLYIFLWYWTGLVAICTAISIPLWMIRLGILRNRMHFIKKFLRINEQFQRADKLLLKSFTQEFLRHDGVFLLRMISMNSGDVITSEVIKELWRMYCTKQSSSIKSDHDSSPPEPPSLRDRRATAPEPPQLDKTNYGTNSSMKKRSFVWRNQSAFFSLCFSASVSYLDQENTVLLHRWNCFYELLWLLTYPSRFFINFKQTEKVVITTHISFMCHIIS